MVLESPIHADLVLIKAERVDRWGRLSYRVTARNFGPMMAMAARTTLASVHEGVELGALDPESVVAPGLFVQRVLRSRAPPPRREAARHRPEDSRDEQVDEEPDGRDGRGPGLRGAAGLHRSDTHSLRAAATAL